MSRDSVPLQWMSSRKIGPLPSPNSAAFLAAAASSNIGRKRKKNHLTNTLHTTMITTAYLHWAIAVVCKPHVHHFYPTSHHTLYPRYCWSTPPLVPQALYHLPPASHHHHHMRLKKASDIYTIRVTQTPEGNQNKYASNSYSPPQLWESEN